MKWKKNNVILIFTIFILVFLSFFYLQGCTKKDTTPPTVIITSPSNNSTVYGIVKITVNAIDDVKISKVEFYIDGNKVGEDYTQPYEYEWDTSNLEYNSTHRIKAKATDTSNNVGESQEIIVTIGDKEAPVVNIINPKNGDILKGIVEIEISAIEKTANKIKKIINKLPSGLYVVELYIDGTKRQDFSQEPYKYSWDTTKEIDGTHTILATAKDIAGNQGELSITIKVDNTNPTVSITNPLNNSKVEGVVTIKANANDNEGIDRVEFFVDNVLLGKDTIFPYELLWNTDNYTYSSVHTIKAIAYDKVGNYAESDIITVTITDTKPPEVNILSPNNGDIVSGIVKIKVDVVDKSGGNIKEIKKPIINKAPSGVDKVEIYVDGNLKATLNSTPYEYDWDTSGLLYGSTHTIGVKAYDKAGNGSSLKTIQVAIGDNEKPSVTITNPQNNSIVSGIIKIQVTADDKISGLNKIIPKAPSGINKVEFYVDNTKIGEDTSSPYEISWDTTQVSDGDHIIKAKAYDVAGNSSDASITVKVDNTGPTISITEPANNAIVRGTISIKGSANDPNGLSKVELYINDILKQTYTSNSFEYSWDTTNVQDGDYTIKVKAEDSLGNTSQKSISVKVDNTGPTVSITEPANNAVVGGLVTIKVTVNDANGIDKVEFYIDNTLLGSDASSPYEITWDTKSYSDGNYTITVKAIDKAGNTSQTSITVRVDNTAPFVSIINPVDGSYVKGTITIQATATSQLGVSKIEFYVDNTKIGEDTSSPYEISWNTAQVSDGDHTIKAKAYDIVNNSREVSIAVKVDNTAPSVSITSPSNNAIVEGIVNIQVNTTDNYGISKVEFYVDNVKLGEATESPYVYAWNTDNLTYSSTHTIFAKAIDLAGNVGTSSSISVSIGDTKAPEITFVNPQDGDKVSGTVKIQVTVVDKAPGIKILDKAPSGITKVEFYIDGVLKLTDTSEPYEYNWSTLGLEYNTTHTITAKAYDKAGNIGEKSITVKIGDTLAPSVTIDSPSNNALISGTFTISASVIDKIGSKEKIVAKAPSGISKVEFYLDNKIKGTSTVSPYQCSVDSKTETDGLHTILVKAYDLENNIGTASISITIDNTPPTVSITNPLGGEVTGTVSITVTANDTNGISKVEFYINNVKKGEDTEAPYVYEWNTAALQYGSTHTIFAKAYDKAGNSATSSPIAVTIGDALPPLITITSPPKDSYIAGSVNIFASVIDKVMGEDQKIIEKGPSGISYVEFFIDDASVQSFYQGPYTYTWNTLNYGDGLHTIKVSATDNVGNSTYTSIQVTVDNTPPIVNINTPYEGEMVKGFVSISISADDNFGISKVEYYADGIKRGEITQAPYTYSWNSTSVLNGNHTITVKVYDLANNVTEKSVIVQVNNWQKVFGNEWSDESGYSIVKTSDGYIIVGRPNVYLLKIDNNGDVTWSKTYTEGYKARSIRPAYGGYVLAVDNSFWKIDTNGNITLKKDYSSYIHYAIQSSDYCYLVAGRNNDQGFVEKFDIYGDILWTKYFSWDWYYSKCYAVEETSDAGYIVVGRLDYGNIFVAKIDPLGNISWMKNYWTDCYYYWDTYWTDFSHFDVKETYDGNFIICGYRYWDGWIYVMKLDSSGNLIWDKQLNKQGIARRILLTPDGGYIFVGSTWTNTYGGWDAYVFKLDENGNMVWEINVGGTSDDYAYDIAETNDGCYFVVGETYSFGGYWQVYLFKIDANGNMQ